MTHPRRRDTGASEEERAIAREIVKTMDEIEEVVGVPPRRGIRSRAGFERSVAERAGWHMPDIEGDDEDPAEV